MKWLVPVALLLTGITAYWVVRGIESPEAPIPTAKVSALGQATYLRHCAACHGTAAAGTETGPPLVHRIYEPSHHADLSFQRAIIYGVQQHHWSFGDMPAISGVEMDEVAEVTAYIRSLQRAAGLF